METHALIRFDCSSSETLKRVHYYLDSDTRPCFEEDVPVSELPVFETMEFAPSPIKIINDGLVIDSLFENAEFEELNSMIKALSRWTDHCYLFFADDEEYKAYFELKEGQLVGIYSLGEDDILDEHLHDLDWGQRALDKVLESMSSA
ncbi:hypothetical protein [Litoribrevibacter albus]|uniref:Uncharacterized protein n=1 Tax=Litoribrevibacter albus TaxID=1473156 RepID=A0AA37W970_9GAMM|nr:hypothetical protein [Litoribrevibacter albus]GLQ32396.1 hypothetical protein GCM10007876_28750 [Litoribrevibacter albus]